MHYNQLVDGDETLGIDPVTKVVTWQPILEVNLFDYDGEMVHWKNPHGFDALTTPNHRWLTAHRDRDGSTHWDAPGRFMETQELSGVNSQIITGGGVPQCFPTEKTFSDELVELIGWAVTEGHYAPPPVHTAVTIAQSETANPENTWRIRRLVKLFAAQGATATEFDFHHSDERYKGMKVWHFGAGIGNVIRQLAPDKRLLPEFLTLLTEPQAVMLLDTLIAGDGHLANQRCADGCHQTVQTKMLTQNRGPLVDDVQMLAALLGIRTAVHDHSINPKQVRITFYALNITTARHLKDDRVPYKGIVWCPRTPTGTWLARRNGGVYWTGNSYTELWTESSMESFINDELMESQENPLGVIPFVHISNTKVPSSPWGLSDIQDVTDLNRQYNETATLIADMIDYYASPLTVIIGAKSNNLERGPKKVWAIPNDKARIENLVLGAGLDGPIKFLEYLKEKMHEIVGIPVNALGQEQQISNTSGVALTLQFLPLMQKAHQKQLQYAAGLAMVNELIIRTAALYLPQMLEVDLQRDPPLEAGQLPVLDPRDPLTYHNTVVFASPLPLDKLVALNEIQMEMGLGLESKVGALRKLGHPYPKEKFEELLRELQDDVLEQGALDMLKTMAQLAIDTATGTGGIDPTTGQVVPSAGGPPGAVGGPPEGDPTGAPGVPSAGGPGVTSATSVAAPPPRFIDQAGTKEAFDQLMAMVAGTKIAQVRNPRKAPDED